MLVISWSGTGKGRHRLWVAGGWVGMLGWTVDARAEIIGMKCQAPGDKKRWRNGTVTSFIPLRGGASNVLCVSGGGRDSSHSSRGGAFAWSAWSKASFWGTECAGGGDNGRQGRQAGRGTRDNRLGREKQDIRRAEAVAVAGKRGSKKTRTQRGEISRTANKTTKTIHRSRAHSKHACRRLTRREPAG